VARLWRGKLENHRRLQKNNNNVREEDNYERKLRYVGDIGEKGVIGN
jgi:hypothetical protein